MDENAAGYANEGDVTEALDRLTRAVYEHALITALAGFNQHGTSKIGAQLAEALVVGDEERARRLRAQLRGLFS